MKRFPALAAPDDDQDLQDPGAELLRRQRAAQGAAQGDPTKPTPGVPYDKNGHPVVDTQALDKSGHVPTHRLDQPTNKLPDETWPQYEQRVLANRTFSPDTARVSDLGALVPEVADSTRSLISAARAAGVALTPDETRRSQERQEMLFQRGRAGNPGDVATWTLTSNHTPGRAVDFSGTPAALQWLQQNAPAHGFNVLGAMDPGHVEMPGGAAQSVAQSVAQAAPRAPITPAGRQPFYAQEPPVLPSAPAPRAVAQAASPVRAAARPAARDSAVVADDAIDDPNDPGAELLRRRTAAAAAPTAAAPKAPASPPANPYDYGRTDQLLRGLSAHATGITVPAVDATLDWARQLGHGGPSFMDAFRQRQGQYDASRVAWEKNNPGTAFTYETAGGLVPMLATMGLSTEAQAANKVAEAGAGVAESGRGAKVLQGAKQLGQQMAHGAGLGGAFGAFQGAADARGDVGDVAKQAGIEAALSAAGGAALVPVIAGGMGLVKGVGRLFQSPAKAAMMAAAEHLAPGMATDAAAGRLPPAAPADFETLPIDQQGPIVRQIARDIGAKPTPAGVRIRQVVADRAAQAREAVGPRLERGTGMTQAAAESLTRGIADDEAARVAANDAQQADYTTALATRKAELAQRAAEPEPEPPDPLAALRALTGSEPQNNIATLRAQRAERSAAAAQNFGAARASSVPITSSALDALAETDLGKTGLRWGEQQTAQRAAAARALGEPAPALAAPAATAPTIAPTVAPPAPAPTSSVGGIPGVPGRTGQALLRTGDALPVEYRVVSRGDVQASHDPFSFAVNPNYPEGVQGRDYLRNKGIQNAVTRRTFEFSPDIALNPSESLSEGVPTILPNGTVIAGNERAMLLSRVAEQQPERHAAYVEQLKARANQYGIDPATIDGVKDPMLVRVLADPAETAAGPQRWAELNRLSDEVATKGKSSVEEGAARATALMQKPGALAHLSDTLDPDQTVNQYLGTADGRQFVRQLVSDGVIRADELSKLTEAGGALNEEGRNAVRKMMLSTAVTRPSVLLDAPPSSLQKLEHAIPSIVSTRGTPFDITGLTTEALGMLGEARDMGMSVGDLVGQQGLFGADVPRSPSATQLAQFLEHKDTKAGAVKVAFRKYAKMAQEVAADENNMFGPPEIKTVPDMLAAAFGPPQPPEAPALSLAPRIEAPAPTAAPAQAAPVAPSAPVAPREPVGQLPTAAQPPRAAAGLPGALPPLAPPPGKMAPPPPTGSHGGTDAVSWDNALRKMQAAGAPIPWVDAPAAKAGAEAAAAAPSATPEPKQYNPESIHYAKQYFARVAKLGVNDGQGGALATQAHGALQQWEAIRQQLRANPLWANADDVFANQSRHIDMTKLGRNLTRSLLDPASDKAALTTSLDAIKTRVAAASPSEQAAFRSAGQGSIADYFRKGGSRVGLIKQLGDPASQWSQRVALAIGDDEAPAQFRAALLTPSRPMPPELAALMPPADAQLSPIAAARKLGYDAPSAKLSPSANQAAAGKALPSVEAALGALPPAEQRAHQQAAAAQVLGDWYAQGRRMKSPGRFFDTASPERQRQLAFAFPTPEDQAAVQEFTGATDRAQALHEFISGGSTTQPRQSVATWRKQLMSNPLVDAVLQGTLYGHPLAGAAVGAARRGIESSQATRQAMIDDLISRWLVTPGDNGLTQAMSAYQQRQLQAQAVRRILPRVAGAAGAATQP